MTKPGGDTILLEGKTRIVADTDRPGVYGVDTKDGTANFVVQLDPLESDTTPLSRESFEQAGCRLARPLDMAAEEARMQQLRDVELESRQKVWKWLVAVAIGLLIVETLLAGWMTRTVETQLATT